MSAQLDLVLSRVASYRNRGKEWDCLCPAHDDKQASLGVREGDIKVVMTCQAGCSYEQICAAMNLQPSDLYYEPLEKTNEEPEGIYKYTDEDGTLLFEVVRFPGKQFRQRRADGNWGLGGCRRVLYNLPGVVEGIQSNRFIFVTEGEKDAEAIIKAGGVGTCNPMGAGAWRPEYTASLAGGHIRVVADRDVPGREHARAVAEQLHGVALSVQVIEPASGKDVWDHLHAGFSLEDFIQVREGVTPLASVLQEIRSKPPESPRATGAFSTRFFGSRLYILGGYTGEGKTSLALQHAVEAAEAGANVLFASLEMPIYSIAKRAAAIVLKKNEEVVDLAEAAQVFQGWSISVREATSMDELRPLLKRDYDLLVIDHLHHEAYGDRMTLASRAKAIHNWARTFNLPILVLVQLTEKRGQWGTQGFQRPDMASIRDAADISHVGDLVQLIYRPRDENGVRGGATELLTVKNRYGPEGRRHLYFSGETHRFDPDVAYEGV